MVLESAGQMGHLFHYKSTSDLAIKVSNNLHWCWVVQCFIVSAFVTFIITI